MHARKIFFILISLSLMAALVPACAPAQVSTDPVTVVRSFYQLLNAKDLNKAMDLTAEDYVMNDPFGTYNRTEAAVQWQAVLDAGLSFDQTNFVDTGNGRVTSCYEVFENGVSIDKGCGNVTHVRAGKIVFDGLEAAERIWVVQRYYEALKDKDIDKAMAYAADDIIASDTTGYYYGRQEVAAAIQRGWDAGMLIEGSDFKTDGDRVASCYKYYENGVLLDQNCNSVTHVRNGKIIFDGVEPLEALFVVRKFYEALNAGDVEEAMSWVAPAAQFINPTGRYETPQAIRASLEALVRDGITFELSKYHMIGARVSYEYKVLDDGQQIDSGSNGLTIVRDGKVVFDGTEETAP